MLAVQIEKRQDPASVRQILDSLPGWFGVEEAVDAYVRDASRLDSFLALLGRETVGVALVKRHFPESAELSLIAVEDSHRGKGLGSALLAAVETALASEGCRFLQVHTVGPSFKDESYAQTRAFYRSLGFVPLQEFHRIDWDGPTLVLVKSV